MPIYEYRCATCARKSSIFFKSFAAVEGVQQGELACPRCGAKTLNRLFSRFAVGKAAASEGEEIYDFDRMMANVDEDDPRSLARLARQMQRETGEDIGPEFDEAMERIEGGEDPDTVMDEIEPPASSNEGSDL